MIFRNFLSWIRRNQRLASALVLLLAPAFAQSPASSPYSPAPKKKRLTQAEWYAEQNRKQAQCFQDAHDRKYVGRGGSQASDNIYELPAVKKLGIKPPPRNHLKQDSFSSAQERDRAIFLDKQATRHRELTSRIVYIYRAYPNISTSKHSIPSLVSDLNFIASSQAWKRMANSNIKPLFAGDDKRLRDEISCGLSSIDSLLSDFEYRATHNGEPDSIVHVFSDPTTLPEGWQLAPADRRQRKRNIMSMRGYNDAARDKYIQDHPDDPHAYNFIAPKAIGAGGHVIDNPNARSDPLNHY